MQVIFVDDDASVRDAGRQTLELAGFDVVSFANAESALDEIDKNYNGVIVSDVRLPGKDGLALLDETNTIDADIPVVLITAHGDISMAVNAMQQGADDFLEKPVQPQRLTAVVKRCLDKRKLVLENRQLKLSLAQSQGIEKYLVGQSAAMDNLRQQIIMLAQTPVDVLVEGETGAGKEVVANCIHRFDSSRTGPFVALNCGALPESIIESELFGHERGAFTGAEKKRIGKIEYANGGTLFLDEIESMPLTVQIKFLRVLQEHSIERLGSNKSISVDFRVIAASKIDLKQAADENKFRLDLYYRLAVAHILVPPLRDRPGDALVLFEHFCERAVNRYQKSKPEITAQLIQDLNSKVWEGNVRELKAFTERHVLGLNVLNEEVSSDIKQMDNCDKTLKAQLDCFEKQLIQSALRQSNGRLNAASDLLAIPRKTLYLRMQKYGLEKTDFVTGQK